MGDDHDQWVKDALGVAVDSHMDKKERVAALHGRRKALQAELDKLEAEKPPDEQARELQQGLAEIQELLSNTSKDAGERSKQIKEYVEKVEKANPNNPKVVASLKKITDFAGKVGKGVGDVGKKLDEINKELSKAQELLQMVVTNFEVMESGSATDQLNEFKKVFDKLRQDVPGLDEMPGVSQMLEIYSEAIAAIAKSTEKIEGEVKRRDDMQKDMFGTSLYMHAKSKREQLADRRSQVAGKLAETDHALEEEGGDEESGAGENAKPRTRKEVADEICGKKCAEGRSHWSDLNGRAQELMRQKSAADAALNELKSKLKSMQDASPETTARLEKGIQECEKGTAYLQSQLDHPPANENQDELANVTKPMLAKQQENRKMLVENLERERTKLKWAAEAVASAEKALTDQITRTQAAVDAAATAKTAYDKCRLDCYKNAIAAGDLTKEELPDDLKNQPAR